MSCEDVQEKLLLGEKLNAAEAAHLRSCDSCGEEGKILAAISAELGSAPPPTPPSGLSARTLRVAVEELAARRDRLSLARMATVLVAALIPLPVILAVDVYVLRALYTFLARFLPEGLSLYLVGGQAALVAFLLALTYGSIPLLAERQRRALRGVSDA